ncbi:hypothetical protein BDN70DRAFT_989692 [Pholiota conissans]|uniref:Uncharacterized protein n=1 Tax=Pholiota conissans TaxID=109636 RepID=A0A9P5ZAR4_9AGAR|nr:hypothetical protein BDN70DRAFT_989692 [Pholiota conissans]
MASASTARSQLPELDLVAIAKTTRKTLDRLASFSRMRSSSEPNPLLTKILNKILGLIGLIDSSMLVAQLGYQLATDIAILYDTEAVDWEADITIETLREIAGKAQSTSQSVMEGFREIRQEVYKIAASTKDDMFVVLVPPDPTHSETMKIHLKDVGNDLVANLSLFSEFSRSATSLAEWCEWMKDDLGSETSTLLPSNADDTPAKVAKWTEMKDAFQEYYNVVNVAHLRFPELLVASSTAWKSVALARSQEPSTAPHSLHEDVARRADAGSPTQGHRLRAFVGKFGFGRTKNIFAHSEKKNDTPSPEETDKRRSAEENRQTLVRRTSSRSTASRNSAASQANRSTKEAVEMKGRFPFSCCSTHLFQDGIAYLGNHVCMVR